MTCHVVMCDKLLRCKKSDLMNQVDTSSSFSPLSSAERVDWDTFLSLDGMINPLDILQKNATLDTSSQKSMGPPALSSLNDIPRVDKSTACSSLDSNFFNQSGLNVFTSLDSRCNDGEAASPRNSTIAHEIPNTLSMASISFNDDTLDSATQKAYRKRKVLTETEREDKAKIRVLKNRRAAQESRDKKKAYIASLEETNRKLQAENKLLFKKLQNMEAQNQAFLSLMNQFSLNSIDAQSLSKLPQDYQNCNLTSKSDLKSSQSPFATPPWSPMPAYTSSSPDLSETSDHSLEDPLPQGTVGNLALFPEFPQGDISDLIVGYPSSSSPISKECHFGDSLLSSQVPGVDVGTGFIKHWDKNMLSSCASQETPLMLPSSADAFTRLSANEGLNADEDKKMHALGPATRYLFECGNPIGHSAFVRKEPQKTRHPGDASLNSFRSRIYQNQDAFSRMHNNRYKSSQSGSHRKSQFNAPRTVGRILNMGFKLASIFVRGARKK